MPAARYVRLSEWEDRRLQEIEGDQGLSEKVRLRARVVRLSHRSMGVGQIAEYIAKNETTVLRYLDRWENRGVEGLADGYSGEDFGRRSPLGGAEKAFLKESLAEDRAWTATTLAEAVNQKFGLRVNRESMRVCLLEMGYTWQRQRYVPVRTPSAEVLEEASQTLGGLKKRLNRVRSP